LEWTTPVEHIHGNWPGEIPTVYRWPYDYSKPGNDADFIPQSTPLSQTMSSNLLHDWDGNEAGIEAQKAYNREHNREEEG
jgi:cytochrome c oxidase subunit 1